MSKKEGPDHSPRFSATATLTINNKPLTFHSSNSCKSSKEAQNDAARSAYLHFTQPPPPPPPLRPSIPYSSSSSSSFAPFPQPSLSSSSSGIGNADLDIEAVTVTTQTLQPNTQQTPHFNALPLNNNFTVIDMQHLYKNQLQNYVQKRNLSPPAYSCEREGPPHASQFRCKVTIDGHTYESPEFFSTLKDAENAAVKVALESLSPDEAKEDDSGLYKNLLQELVQKEGFSLPVYDTNRSGEVHVPIFVSTVEIEREIFKGHEAKTKKQAEMSAAKIAYTTLKALIDMQHLYKNQLQNYVQKRNLSPPVYSCEREGLPHASRFRCKVTIDGHTYESPEFFSTLKDAEHAATKVALKSLSPDEAKEDDSGLFKNLLQELVQKEGFSLPVYDTNRSGEVHVPIFVSTVEIEREIFKGHEARTKKQAEMSAAKIAYATLKARKSGQGPLIVCPAHKGQEAPEFSSSSLQPNVTADQQQHVGPKATMNLNPCTIAERQAKEDRGEFYPWHFILSLNPCTIAERQAKEDRGKKQKKPCFLCAGYGHNWKYCKQDCFVRKERGPSANDFLVRHQDPSSNICLRCGGSGHNMFSCRSEYSPDDLKEIQCYVCQNFGHICCVGFQDMGPRQASCYSCGQSGHLASECVKACGETSGSKSPALCYHCGEEGHFARRCTNHVKLGQEVINNTNSEGSMGRRNVMGSNSEREREREDNMDIWDREYSRVGEAVLFAYNGRY